MEKIYCYIKVTPFVMRYLNINFGAKNPHVPNAISLKKDKILSHMLRTMLSKQSHRYDNRTLGYRYTNRFDDGRHRAGRSDLLRLRLLTVTYR